MKTSKVKTVQANGTFESQYGSDLGNGKKGFYKFEYEMEDGQVVNASHKTKDGAFNPGDEVEYEITNTQYNNGKVRKPQQNFKSGYDTKGIEVGHAINNAVNLMAAGVELEVKECKTNEEKIYLYAKQIMQISNRLKNE